MTAMSHIDRPASPLGPDVATMRTFYAGFWRRLMAAAIDCVLMLALFIGIAVAAGGPVTQATNDKMFISMDGRMIPLSEVAKTHVVVTRAGRQTTTVETTTATVGLQTIRSVVTRTVDQKTDVQPGSYTSADFSVSPSPLAFALFFVLWLLYTSVLESSRLQGTLGKLAMFIRVADEEGRRVSLPRSLARNALKLISAVPLFIGYLMAGWTAKKQSLHDLLAGCTVDVKLG
jgi:uncharacterized RDD family membrane protein YckC